VGDRVRRAERMSAAWSLKYRVRRGHRGDARAVLGIFVSAMREHGFDVGEDDVSADVVSFGSGARPAQDDYVVVSGGKVCGFLSLGPTTQPGCAELLRVFVARSHRGRGVGTMLIEQCVGAARERGYRQLVLETHTAFVAARRYYESHGWTLLPHWPGAGSTARVYERKLYGARLVEAGAETHPGPGESGVRTRIDRARLAKG
jgi:GNAT superfamily N-acetyltransferase